MTLLRVDGLTKSFGGITANANIALEIGPREAHAVIGPNGAGKTTLVAQLAGEIVPTAGTIRFNGRDITALPAHTRAAAGLARTFQITSILASFSVLENVSAAVQAHAGHSFRFWARADDDEGLNTRARAVLARVGLAGQESESAANLSHGAHRQLEIAMALASAPQLLLLDEPTAGMGPEESRNITALLAELKQDHAMLLVEHDMQVVFSIADRITVLDNGCVIASGSPAEIQSSAAVRKAYLGDAAARLGAR